MTWELGLEWQGSWAWSDRGARLGVTGWLLARRRDSSATLGMTWELGLEWQGGCAGVIWGLGSEGRGGCVSPMIGGGAGLVT